MFTEHSCWASAVSRSLCLWTPACLASRCGDMLAHIPHGIVPGWTYDCHQLVMPKWCEEQLHLSYSLSGFMAHGRFRDTPVFLYSGHGHNMLTESWDYLMKHMTFHDKSSLQNVMEVHWLSYSLVARILLLPRHPEHLIYAWSRKAFYYKNLMLQEHRHFFLFVSQSLDWCDRLFIVKLR